MKRTWKRLAGPLGLLACLVIALPSASSESLESIDAAAAHAAIAESEGLVFVDVFAEW